MNTLKVFPPQSKTDITVVTVTKDRTEEDEKKFIRSVAEAIFRGQQHVSSFEGAGLQFMVFEGLSPEQGEIICQTAPKFPNPTEEKGESNGPSQEQVSKLIWDILSEPLQNAVEFRFPPRPNPDKAAFYCLHYGKEKKYGDTVEEIASILRNKGHEVRSSSASIILRKVKSGVRIKIELQSRYREIVLDEIPFKHVDFPV